MHQRIVRASDHNRQESEPAAVGAAYQAAAVLAQRSVEEVAREWGRVSPVVSAARPADSTTLQRLSHVLHDLSAINNPY